MREIKQGQKLVDSRIVGIEARQPCNTKQRIGWDGMGWCGNNGR